MSDESEYLRVQSVYLAPSEPESFTLFALDTQGMTIPEYLAQFNAKAVRVLAVTSPQGTLELVPDDTAPEGVALLWNGERRYPAPMSATPEGVENRDHMKKLKGAIFHLEEAVEAWKRGDRPYEHVQARRDCVVIAAEDMRDAAIAAHVAARVGEERERCLAICEEERVGTDNMMYTAAAKLIAGRIRMEAP